jgi:hypothetical protein
VSLVSPVVSVVSPVVSVVSPVSPVVSPLVSAESAESAVVTVALEVAVAAVAVIEALEVLTVSLAVGSPLSVALVSGSSPAQATRPIDIDRRRAVAGARRTRSDLPMRRG